LFTKSPNERIDTMPMITNTDLRNLLDKLARWGTMSVGDSSFGSSFNAGMTSANAAVMSGSGSLFQYLATLAATDADPAADMLESARNLDEANPTPPTRFLFGITSVAAFLNALNNHIKRYNPATTTLDAYLLQLNATTPTLRVHQAFSDHLKLMSRKNVFVGADTILATFAATGATAGTFTSLTTLANYAGAKLVVKNQGAVTTGATLTVTGKKLDDTTQAITATIATGTDNTETDLSSTVQSFVQVTGVTITGGTNANTYKIVAKTDRSIAAA
jgi:hypothetical protein